MRYSGLKKHLAAVLSAGCLLLSCAHRGVCPPFPPAPAEGAEHGYVPASSLHERLSATLQRGPLQVPAEGDLFFAPPDTLRLELRAEWGEVLFDLRVAGRTLRASTPEGELPLGRDALTAVLLERGALVAFLTGRPGLSHCLDTAGRKAECVDGLTAYHDGQWRVTLEKEGNRVAKVASLDSRFRYDVIEEKKVEGEILPFRYRFQLADGPSVTLETGERETGRPVSGTAILK